VRHIQSYHIYEYELSPIKELLFKYSQSSEEIEFIGEIEGVKVMSVDREKISHKHPQWKNYIGSHHWGKESSYIPEDSIWVAQGLSLKEFIRVVNHELIERKMMRDLQDNGMTTKNSWNIAHHWVKDIGF